MNDPHRVPSAFDDLLATRETPDRALVRATRHRSRPGRRKIAALTEQRSLFGEILDWMFAPLLLMWPLSVALTFLAARAIADVPFDRSLIDRTLLVAQHVRSAPAVPPAESLERLAGDLLHQDAQDEGVVYQVRDEYGALLAGEKDIPEPRLYDFTEPGTVRVRNALLHNVEMRVAYVYTAEPDGRVLVQVGETLDRRSALANDIIKSVIFPQFVILPMAIALVWFGLSRGLAPLTSLQLRIRERRPDDLSPIDPREAPEEVAPLVDAFNDLLARQSQNLVAQKRFIADAAHQMKTPLAGLRMQAELALRDSDPVQLRSTLAQLARSSQRSAHLINQLLALARTENLRNTAVLQPLDLRPLAHKVASDWADAALSRRIDFGVEDDALPATIAGNELLLREMIGNLVDNALRYTPEGGVVTLRTRSTDHETLLEVEDNGSGIPEHEREMVFERFYRVPGVQVDGSGLGLPIVREIASQHGATVTIEDAHPALDAAAARGTRVTVRFPKRHVL